MYLLHSPLMLNIHPPHVFFMLLLKLLKPSFLLPENFFELFLLMALLLLRYGRALQRNNQRKNGRHT